MPDDQDRPLWGQPEWVQDDPRENFDDAPSNSERLYQAVNSAVGEEEHGRPATPRKIVEQMFGRTKGRLNTRAAADHFGVSQRTVQRWIHDRKLPTSPGGQTARQGHQHWRHNTSEGRRKTLTPARRERLHSTRSITFTGQLRISHDVRQRNGMEIEFDEGHRELVDAMLDAMASGDDTAARAAFEDLIEETGSWGSDIEVKIDQIQFGDGV